VTEWPFSAPCRRRRSGTSCCAPISTPATCRRRAGPWHVIDPKPYVGDPTYDVVPHLLNSDARLVTDPKGLVWQVADLAGLDRDRVLLWLFARCVKESPDRPVLGLVARRIAPT
jgi:hypothetical protein